MRIAIAADHAGFLIKDDVINLVQSLDHDVIDLGTYDQEPVDYPDYALKLGKVIVEKQADRGILICGSGAGACIAANKIKGIYASICHDTYLAHQAVEHDNINVLCLGSRIVGVELVKEIVKAFLSAQFIPEERFVRRFEKVRQIEASE
ncbi:MAG TPA: ribose 5-phosphate isomerase B [Anaerolineaceae bacterium]|nr:ribose 5-phosphate isomerase B [Anaerolineaceae bacterium]HOV06739.1 ribose 5-phosphate isomerase B [Anaerolineaceae bacterium]